MSPHPRRLDRPALVVIDVQRGFDDGDFWGPRDNPACETNISAVFEHWRTNEWPLVFVQHESDDPESPLASASSGGAFKDIISGTPDLLVRKSVNSSFYGTPDLDAWLRAIGCEPRTTAVRPPLVWRAILATTHSSRSTRRTPSTGNPRMGLQSRRRRCRW